MRTWTIASGAKWAKDKKRFRKFIMDDFGVETLSDDCSYEKANQFIEFLEPKAKLAEKELNDNDVTETEELEEVDLDDVEVDEVLSEADKKKIDEITHTQEAI